jgi:PleD family two-component response regulator
MRERVRLVGGELEIESALARAHGPRLGACERRSVMKRPSVLIADDHRMVAEALKSLLAPEFELLGVVEEGWR